MSNRSWLALAFLVVAIGIAVLWRAVGSARHAAAEVQSAPRDDGSAAGPVHLSADASSDPSLRGPAPTVEETSKPTHPIDASTMEIDGTVVVVDESGAEHATEDGFLMVMPGVVTTAAWQRIEVRRGHWYVRVPKATHIGVGRMELGERTTVCERSGTSVPLPSDGNLALRAQWSPATLLHVRDAADHSELEGVEIVRRGWLVSAGAAHPGPYSADNVLAKNAKSPVELSRLENAPNAYCRTTYYARSPGRAWAAILIDFVKGGESELLLKSGGELEVVLTGSVAPTYAHLRVRGSDQHAKEPEAEQLVHSSSNFSFDSLELGRYTISVELGAAGDDPDSLGSREVEVLAGQKTSVILELHDLPPTDKVRLEGVVVVPKEWGLERFTLTTELLDNSGGSGRFAILQSRAIHRLEPAGDTWSFAFPAVRPGPTTLTVNGTQWWTTLDVGSQGVADARIEVPPPARVSVRPIDTATRADADVAGIRWTAKLPDGSHGTESFYAHKIESSGRYVLLTAWKQIEVEAESDVHVPVSKVFTLQGADNEITLELERRCGFDVLIKDGDVAISVDRDAIWARRLDGKGRTTDCQDRERSKRCTVTGPGLYRVTIRDLDGYLRVPPPEVRVQPGEFTPVVVQLQRKP